MLQDGNDNQSGQCKIPHFAHKNSSSCRASSEPESAYHLMGKRKLFQWFLSHGYQVDLEAYLPEIKKRADILVRIGGNRYADRISMFSYPRDGIHRKNKAYQSIGIKPIWILAAKQLKKEKFYEFSISRFHWLFVTGSFHHPFLWMYCPETDHLSVLKNLTPFTPRTVFAELTTASLKLLPPSRISPQNCFVFLFYLLWRYKRNGWSPPSSENSTQMRSFFPSPIFTSYFTCDTSN